MLSSNISGVLLFLLSAFIHGVHNLDYTDLQALGVACPDQRDRCTGYASNLTYVDRNCECDFACNSYKDCCIDALRRPNRRTSLANRMACMPYGAGRYQGVYVIVNCSNSWQGSVEVRQRCEGPEDLSDPLNAAPVTSVAQGVTYRNRFCAECNYANLPTLKTFQIKMRCEGLTSPLTQEQIFEQMIYNQTFNSWGVNRMNTHGNATNFNVCDMVFDVPGYLNNSVRFCRSTVISSCPPEWNRPQVKKHCEDYMAVVYGNEDAYRNVHCALCNNMTVQQVSCGTDLSSRRRPTASFVLLLDINTRDTDEVGIRGAAIVECPPRHIYDPITKQCRQLVCALRNHVLQDGRCVRG